MNRVLEWFRDQGNRGYLYRVLMLAGAVAVGYGLISGEELALWLGLLAVVLNVSPVAYTPTGAQLRASQDHPESEQYPPGPGRDVRRKFDR